MGLPDLSDGQHVIAHSGVPRFELHLDTFIGGPNNIYHAHDLKYDRPILLKVGFQKAMEEVKVYQIINGIRGVPRPYTWCPWDDVAYLNMERVATVIADTLSTTHHKGVIHWDIKPHNIVCSSDNGIMAPRIVIDWGLGAVTRSDMGLVGGTPGFANVSTLYGNAPHALDDFESLIYVVEYLIRGHLPWSHLIGTMRDRNYGPMLELQKPWAPENAALQEFLRYTRDLREDREVDYSYIKELLLRASESE